MLEALSGVQLPRGREITTRVPLILRLINTAVDKDGNGLTDPKRKKRASGEINPADGHQGSGPAGADVSGRNVIDGADSYAIISIVSPAPSDGEVIYDLSQIGTKVEQAQAKLAGRGIGVVSKPIYLSVFRAYSPDLTLVDLPGITRNPVGDQPKDIYQSVAPSGSIVQ